MSSDHSVKTVLIGCLCPDGGLRETPEPGLQGLRKNSINQLWSGFPPEEKTGQPGK